MYSQKWDYKYLELAEMWSRNSKDPDKKVGAVITSDRYVIGMGYNGLPRGLEDTPSRLNDKTTKLSSIIHAEENAILSTGANLPFAKTIYVYPCMPCAGCLAKINQTNIARIVSIEQCLSESSSWEPGAVISMAQEMGIEITLYSDFYSYLVSPDYFFSR